MADKDEQYYPHPEIIQEGEWDVREPMWGEEPSTHHNKRGGGGSMVVPLGHDEEERNLRERFIQQSHVKFSPKVEHDVAGIPRRYVDAAERARVLALMGEKILEDEDFDLEYRTMILDQMEARMEHAIKTNNFGDFAAWLLTQGAYDRAFNRTDFDNGYLMDGTRLESDIDDIRYQKENGNLAELSIWGMVQELLSKRIINERREALDKDPIVTLPTYDQMCDYEVWREPIMRAFQEMVSFIDGDVPVMVARDHHETFKDFTPVVARKLMELQEQMRGAADPDYRKGMAKDRLKKMEESGEEIDPDSEEFVRHLEDALFDADWGDEFRRINRELSRYVGGESEGKLGWVYGPCTIHEAPLERPAPKVRIGKKRFKTDMGAAPRAMHRWTSDKRIFDTTRRARGGSVLIDVSGSMSWSRAELNRVLEALPAAVIAVYAGPTKWVSDVDRAHYMRLAGAKTERELRHLEAGSLNVIARNGRMISETYDPKNITNQHGEHIGRMSGGNHVDGTALDWLVQQKGPRFWISDAGVTGYGDHDALLAYALVRIKKGRILRLNHLNDVVKYAKRFVK